MAARKLTGVSLDSRRTPRRLAAAVAVAAAVSVMSPGWAAGLGRLTVQSALGQPLRAELEISSLSKEEAASVSARLAPPEAFRQAGFDFNPALSGLRFSIDRRPEGRAVVLISSSQPLSEPFLDLVVELNWASGKFVRGYTFLLDPPELRGANRESIEGAAVQRSRIAAPTLASRAETPAPAGNGPNGSAGSTGPTTGPATAGTAAAPRPEKPVESAPRRSAGERIEVAPGDTLYSLAARVRPDGITLDQVQAALYRSNPAAFSGGINGLRADAKLVVPDRQSMAAIDPAEARDQVRGQARDAGASKPRAADSVRAAPAATSARPVSASDAPPPPSSPAPASPPAPKIAERVPAPAARDQLKLSGPDAVAAGAALGQTGGASKVAPDLAARNAALGQVQTRLTDLEKSIGELQRLLEVKNRQLAELQKQIDEARNVGRPAVVAGKADAPMPAQAPAAVPGERANVAAAVTPKADEPALAAASVPAGDSAGQPGAPAPVQPPPPEKTETPRAKPAPAPAAPVAPAGFFEDLLESPLILPGAGAIGLLGAGYAWYALRRRRKVESFEDSLIAADGFAANSLFGATGGQSVDTSAGAFKGAASETGVDVNSTEVDPIAEAEVYIAYGREAQAEEILREALSRQPERQALRAKLLEIQSGRKDIDAFNATAAEMYQLVGGRNEEWPRIVAMGLALDPDNPLYAPAEPVGDIAVASAEAGGLEMQIAARSVNPFPALEPTDAERTELQARAGQQKPVETFVEPEVAPLDFDLGLGTTPAPAAPVSPAPREASATDASAFEPPADAAPEGMPALDIAIPSAAAGKTEASKTELEKAIEGRFELPSLDLVPPTRIGNPEQPPQTPPASTSAGTDAALSIDLLPQESGNVIELLPHESENVIELMPATESVFDVDAESTIEIPPAFEPEPEPVPDAGSPAGALAGTPSAIAGDASPAADFAGLPPLELSAVPEALSAAPTRPADFDLSDIKFDLEPMAVVESTGDPRVQDVTTRLDLAAAFVDIGDLEGARELIAEALKDANADQQQRAHAMLEKLG